ncbi:hypothetical protein LJK87_41280 [Paenibacillus sp. P25]|nr:hypothetical protein LJK87_41280 [Paenibacillus sp. P25]
MPYDEQGLDPEGASGSRPFAVPLRVEGKRGSAQGGKRTMTHGGGFHSISRPKAARARAKS